MAQSYLDCQKHGVRPGAVVCCHILTAQGQTVGFIENSSAPEDLQAWCNACETVFQQEGGLTPAFEQFNNRAVVCADCYRSFKARHATAQTPS